MKAYLIASVTALLCTALMCLTAIHITDKRIDADRAAQVESSTELERILNESEADLGGYTDRITVIEPVDEESVTKTEEESTRNPRRRIWPSPTPAE